MTEALWVVGGIVALVVLFIGIWYAATRIAEEAIKSDENPSSQNGTSDGKDGWHE